MKRLLLGISSGILFTFLSIGIALFTAPYFLKFISKEAYGIFFLANNLIVWTGLLNAGLRGSFKWQLASALGKGEDTKRLSTTILITQCMVALVISLAGYILSFFLASFFDLSADLASDASFVFSILSLSFGCTILSNSFAVVLSVHNRDVNVYTARSILLIFQTLISIVLLSFDWGIKGLAIAAILSEITFLAYMYFLLSLKYRLITFDLSAFDRKLLLHSLSIGKWFLAGFLAQLLIRHTDLLLVGKLSGLEALTAFLFTSKLYLLASALLHIIIKIITPQMIRITQSDSSSMSVIKMTMLFLKFVLGFVLIGGTGIYILNEGFIHWWIGESFYLGDYINLMLILAFIFSSLNLAGRALFASKMQMKEQKVSALTEGALHISLSALLGIFYGLEGIATGIALSSILASCISFVPYFINNKNLRGIKTDAIAIFSYVCIVLLVLLILPASPAMGKSFIALSIISGTFILLFLKDFRLILSTFSGTKVKKTW